MIKYISIQINDHLKLQRYLNHQSSKGYHASKITNLKISFTYDPTIQYYYHVILPEKSMNQLEKQVDADKRKDFMSTFGLEQLVSKTIFEIYYSKEKIDFISDPSIHERERKKVLKSFFITTLLFSTLYAFNASTMVTLKLYDVISDGLVQSILLMDLLLIINFIKDILNIYKARKNKADIFLGYRWRDGHLDPAVTFLYIAFILVIGLALPGNLFYPLLGIGILGYLRMLVKSSKKEAEQIRNLSLLFLVLMTTTFIFGVVPAFQYGHRMNTYTKESIFAKENTIYNNDKVLSSLEFKTPFFKSYLTKHFLLNKAITEVPEGSTITTTSNKYGEIIYVYWDYNQVLISIDESMIIEALPYID